MNRNYLNNMNYNNPNSLNRTNSPINKETKKLNFKTIKSNTISSLNDVECFLNKLQHTLRYIKLYKLLK